MYQRGYNKHVAIIRATLAANPDFIRVVGCDVEAFDLEWDLPLTKLELFISPNNGFYGHIITEGATVDDILRLMNFYQPLIGAVKNHRRYVSPS